MNNQSNNKIFTVVICLIAILIVTSATPLTADAASKKEYYIVGDYDYSYLYELHGIRVKDAKLIYRNSSVITVKGDWNKGKSLEKAYKAQEKHQYTRVNKRYKVSRNCKVVEVLPPKNQNHSWNKWRKTRRYKKNRTIRFIECALKVRNGKIVKIYFSA